MKYRYISFIVLSILLAGCQQESDTDLVLGSGNAASNKEYVAFVEDIELDDPMNPIAVIDTQKGMIAFELYESRAPQTVNNFMQLVSGGFYNGLRFHLVRPGFAVQTGDPTGIGTGGADQKGIVFETHPDLSHGEAGMVGMARYEDDLNSATSQFYILLEPHPELDGEYAVFGKTLKGFDVVETIVRGDKINRIAVVRMPAE